MTRRIRVASFIEVDSIRRVEKKDGAAALLFLAVYAVASYFQLKWIPRNENYIYLQLAVQSAWLAIIVLFVFLRKQGLSGLGFRKEPVPYIALGAFTAVAFAYALWKGSCEIAGRWLFYLVAVGGVEEILFRGFLYPRVAKLLGSPVAALVVTGLLFGAMHHLAPMAWEHAPWYGVFSQLGGGLVGTLVFLLIYAATENITNAILVHAALDYAPYVPFFGWLSVLYIIVWILCLKRKKRKIY